jgi:hypothetical protein
MRVDVDATHTVARTVNRLVIDSDAAFDDVRQRYESLVPTIDFAELTALVIAGDLAVVKQYTADHAPHSFVNFWTFHSDRQKRRGRRRAYRHPGRHRRLQRGTISLGASVHRLASAQPPSTPQVGSSTTIPTPAQYGHSCTLP